MAEIIPVFMFVAEASIYILLDLALNLVDLVLWGGVRKPSCHTPFKLWVSLRSMWTNLSHNRGRARLRKPPSISG